MFVNQRIVCTRVIVLDWYDGPREGFLTTARPELEAYFRIHGERRVADDMDDRIFALYEVPRGTVDAIGRAFRIDNTTQLMVTLPQAAASAEAALNAQIEELRARSKANYYLRTKDFESVVGFWDSEGPNT